MSGIFGSTRGLGDLWDTPMTLDNQPATTTTTTTTTTTPPLVARPECGEGETWDANSMSCAKIGMTSTEVKTVVAPAPDSAPASTGKLTIQQALPYVLGAAAAGVLLMVLMKKAK